MMNMPKFRIWYNPLTWKKERFETYFARLMWNLPLNRVDRLLTKISGRYSIYNEYISDEIFKTLK